MPAKDRLEKIHKPFVRIDIGVAPSESKEASLRPGHDPMYYTTTSSASSRWIKLLKKKAQKIPGFVALSADYTVVPEGRKLSVYLVLVDHHPLADEFVAQLPKNWK